MTPTRPKGRPKGCEKTGGRTKGSNGSRVFVTLPKAVVEKIAAYLQTAPAEKDFRVFILKAVEDFLEGQTPKGNHF